MLEWTCIQEKVGRFLGEDVMQRVVPKEVYVPSETQLNKLIDQCKVEHELILRKAVCERKDAARRLNKWDWEENYGRRAFRSSRNKCAPPTTRIADPNSRGGYITDASSIHDHFALGREQIFCAHSRKNSIWENFRDKYGRHIPNVPFQDSPYSAEDFIRQPEK